MNKLQYNFTLITPDSSVDKTFLKVAESFPCIFNIITGGEEQALKRIKMISQDECDAIICRRVVALQISKYTNIPVVSVELTTMDALKLLREYKGKVKNVVLVRADSPIEDLNIIADIFDMNIIQCIFSSDEDLKNQIFSLQREQKVDLIIGGSTTYKAVSHLDIPVVNIVHEEKIILRAIKEAFSLAKSQYDEAKLSMKLNSVVNNIGDGLILVNNDYSVQMINPAAEDLLACHRKNVINKQIGECFPEIDFLEKSLYFNEKRLEFITYKEKSLSVQIVPIIVKQKIAGGVFYFSEIVENISSNSQPKRSKKLGEFKTKYSFDDIYGSSENIKKIKHLAKLYSTSDANLLITGETGTGKELFAQSIHANSSRKNYPFVAVNCAAIPEGLIETELFGYEEGAFTGAKSSGKIGMFELSNNGTLFLDEIGDLPLLLQGRLLRVLQEMEIVRVGGTKLIPLNIRIICATHNDLRKKVEAGLFRADLYYRLNVLSLNLIPLRNHKEDTLSLAIPYLLKNMKNPPRAELLQKEIKSYFFNYDWPGNYREFFNTLERLAIVSHLDDDMSWKEKIHIVLNSLTIEENNTLPKRGIHLPIKQKGQRKQDELYSEYSSQQRDNITRDGVFMEEQNIQENNLNLKEYVQQAEQIFIQKVLAEQDFSIEKAAKILNISRMTLWRKLNS